MVDEIKNVSKSYMFDDESLGAVASWLNEMNIKYNATRFGLSAKIYRKWVDEPSKIPTFRELWGIAELFDLVEFHKLFYSEGEGYLEKINLIKSGSATLEKSQENSARDYAFELKIASRFKRAGFSIINDNSHDVVVENDSTRLFIECKRPRKCETLIDLIRYAFDKQLADVTDKSEQGVICVDLSNIIYNEIIDTFKPNDDGIFFLTSQQLTKYRDDTDRFFRDMIYEQARDIATGVRMIILFYSFPVMVEVGNNTGIGRFQKFNHFVRLSIHNDALDKRISESFMGSAGCF
ncbi:hypothetical protein AB7238_06315 [Providencia alcalifaciens]